MEPGKNDDREKKLEQTREFLRGVAGRESYAHLLEVDEEVSAEGDEGGEIHPCIGEACSMEDPSAYRCRYHYFG